MKRSIILFFATILVLSSFAAPNNKAVNSGLWSTASNWSLNRLPQVGDTITIPAAITIIINDDKIFNGFVYLAVFGTLDFQNNSSLLDLNDASSIYVMNGVIKGNGSPSQKIKLAGTTIYNGGQAPISGYQIANSSTNGFASTGGSVLPVQFSAFTVTRKNTEVLIQWSTATEQNADLFEVQRSTNGTTWVKAGSVKAVGNSTTIQNYSYSDKNASATVYYRVKQVDANGKENFTSVKKVEVSNEIGIASSSNGIVLSLSQTNQKLVLRIVNFNGQIVSQQTMNATSGKVVVATSLKGQYVVSVSNGTDVNVARQVIL